MKFQNPSMHGSEDMACIKKRDGWTHGWTTQKQYARNFFKVGGITKWLAHPVKTQISLGGCPSAQSNQSSLSAWRNLGSLATQWVHREDCPGWRLRMHRLICVFAELSAKVILLVLSWGGSYHCPILVITVKYNIYLISFAWAVRRWRAVVGDDASENRRNVRLQIQWPQLLCQPFDSMSLLLCSHIVPCNFRNSSGITLASVTSVTAVE